MKARGLSAEAVYSSCDSDITVLSRSGCVGLSGPRVTLGRGWVCTPHLSPGTCHCSREHTLVPRHRQGAEP